MNAFATSADETPLFLSAGDEHVFGVVTRPTGAPNGSGFVFMPGAGLPATNRNRLSVRLARRVASLGYQALRIEYHGVGESSGLVHSFSTRKPFVDDLAAAVGWLADQGVESSIVGGSCFGSRVALVGAVQLPSISGVILITPPIRDSESGMRGAVATPMRELVKRALSRRGARALFDARRRRMAVQVTRSKMRSARKHVRLHRRSDAASGEVSPLFLDCFRTLVRRRVPVLFVFGEEDEFLQWFQAALPGPLGALVDDAQDLCEVRILPGRVHGYSTIEIQGRVADTITDWLRVRSSPTDPIEEEIDGLRPER